MAEVQLVTFRASRAPRTGSVLVQLVLEFPAQPQQEWKKWRALQLADLHLILLPVLPNLVPLASDLLVW
jgi:hypothetical protein